MANLQEIFNRIQTTKVERSKINTIYRDAKTASAEYQKIIEELKALKEKKKQLENAIRSDMIHELDELDRIKSDIESDNLLLSDMALNQLMQGQTIELIDQNNNKYEPQFSVKFKKSA